ncbi:serine/threonine protein phosphatase [Candidatus Aerophobetes bacterium]|nr:serine/threonine protein phosphatase [Candidatus Aerophobetes bacterium]
MELRELIREASITEVNNTINLIKRVNRILIEEREKGKIGEKIIEGGLVHLPPLRKAIIIGDLHGDFNSLTFILGDSSFLRKVKEEKVYLVFLGDYGDRGEKSPEVYYTILTLKSIFREEVILLRGNHEGPEDLRVQPHDLPYFLREKYGERWREVYQSLRELFNYLPHSLIVEGRYLVLHGGPPENISSVQDIAYAHQKHPEKKYLEEILWSDPGEEEMSFPSPRGAGRIFGRKVTEKVLKRLGVKVLIRSHQPCQGISLSQEGKVITLFSRKGPPYYNSKAAYLEINLSEMIEKAYELEERAHIF